MMYHFVPRTPKSSSLSHGDEDEQCNIRCHAQTRRRAASRSPAPESVPKPRALPLRASTGGTLSLRSQSTSSLVDADHGATESTPGAALTTSVWNHSFEHVANAEERRSLLAFVSRLSFDPFRITVLPQDPTTYQIFQFVCSDFSNVNFRAEALGPPAANTEGFRHNAALSERVQLSLSNELVMYTTLAYASAAMGWRFGIRYQQRPPEYFIQQAYVVVRRRLNQSRMIDNVLIMSLYSLALSEMWVQNFKAATTHLSMLKQIVEQMGGMPFLDSYVMESVILGTK